MPQIRRYREADFGAFIALDIETGLQTLRYASEADREAFVGRWNTVLKDRFKWDGALGPTLDHACLFVLEDEGTYAGHLWLAERTEVMTGSLRLWVVTVAIVKEFRSRGFGRLLMEHAEAYAHDRGVASVELSVDADNVVARKLYEEMGFQTLRLRMVKNLPPKRTA